ncbi:auxilin-related protein 2-like [Punica granatum]|uniref:Uncharacterized protein n=2 Tax=Punica granatum TaxID=22663 RepID=A0A2I0KDB7_PUNGR|nr:auxilin-related protein 2-like [Punica granatum]PKI66123.1 hypothetical protein CRG98_013481 [Punica granatum]
MNDFEGLLSSEFGFKPQGKSAPMASSSRSASTAVNFDLGSHSSTSFPDSIFNSKPTNNSHTLDDLGDIFGGSARRAGKSESARVDSSYDFESMFNSSSKPDSSMPVYDKPVYDDDDDIFEGVPGIKRSSSSGVKYGNLFEQTSSTSPPAGRSTATSGFDDLLGGFGNSESQSRSKEDDPAMPASDDLIPGFGGTSPTERPNLKPTWSSEPMATSAKTMEDPFVASESASSPAVSFSGVSPEPLEEFNMFGKSGSTKDGARSVPSGVVIDDLDPFDGLGKPVPPFSPENSINGNDRNHLRTEHSNSGSQHYNGREQSDKVSQNTVPAYDDLESHPTFFDASSATGSFSTSVHSHEKHSSNEANIPADMSPGYEENIESSDEVWLTVSEIPLFTQPTRMPPPSRPPPPRPARAPKFGSSSFDSTSFKKGNEIPHFANSSQHYGGANSIPQARTATIEELEDFAMGRSNGSNIDGHVNWASSEELDLNSDAAASAAAMKEAMDRAEAKFRHAKELRERESTKAARSRESVQLEKDENWLEAEERALGEKQERLEQERLQREREEQERERRRIEKEREREEMEKEQRRLEKERERARARQVVERANREARERAAAEARVKAERAAVGKANAEARERAERAAVLRAQAEARERAAAEARERAERAAAEVRAREAQERATEARARAEKAEKATAEAREKEARERAAEARRRAERAAVERAAAEARERAAAEARDRAASSARAKQQSNDNDLESFFSMGRASSAPRPRANYSDPMVDTQFPSKKGPEVARTSDSTPNMRKASSPANIVDDLSSIFGGGVPISGEFQEVEGESEERCRARLERHQRTQERAAKALAEKNQRDLQAQREQAERHRIAESLDVEIKRWAAGKEGNLRALLSTLQYVLWPECGWQPVSLTDLITAAAVKKVYRKATLCIHPDKVQQKGANLQQKYVAEKVFDLLKEAWNKLNSEELF